MTIEERKTNLVNVNINQLTKDPNHPRMNYGDCRVLKKSINHEGIMTPPVVAKINDDTFHIIDGDRRIKIAKEIGIESVACFVYEGLTEAEIAQKSYILNTERNQLNDIERGLHIQKMIDDFGYTYDDLDILGYGSKGTTSRLLSLLELPKKSQGYIIEGKLTKAHGTELRRLEDHSLIDKTAELAIKKEWSAKKIKATVKRLNRERRKGNKPDAPTVIPEFDVPGVYFKDSKDMSERYRDSVGLILTNLPTFVGDSHNHRDAYDEYVDNIKAVLKECSRVLVPGGILAIVAGNIANFKCEINYEHVTRIRPMLHVYDTCLRKYGFYLQDEIIWHKDSNSFTAENDAANTDKLEPTSYRIVNRHEPIYIFKKRGYSRPVPSDQRIVAQSRITREEWETYAQSVWNISPVPQDQGHPSALPDELARRIIKMYSFIGETVLDPFLGSGTTVKVARELGRDGIGYEGDLRYKEIIMKKLGVVDKSDTESVSEHSKKVLNDLESNHSEKPKVAMMASKGIVRELRKREERRNKELENA